MRPDRSLSTLFRGHGLSWTLLVMAYATFGGFLRYREASQITWGVTVALAITGAWLITLGWPQARRVLLWGFQSDIGYFAMALSAASLAVLVVTQFQMFTYFAMLVAVSLLARVDNLISGSRDTSAFLWLSVLALLGLAISWLPTLLSGIAA